MQKQQSNPSATILNDYKDEEEPIQAQQRSSRHDDEESQLNSDFGRVSRQLREMGLNDEDDDEPQLMPNSQDAQNEELMINIKVPKTKEKVSKAIPQRSPYALRRVPPPVAEDPEEGKERLEKYIQMFQDYVKKRKEAIQMSKEGRMRMAKIDKDWIQLTNIDDPILKMKFIEANLNNEKNNLQADDEAELKEIQNL